MVAPMSGHYATLLRGTVRDMLPDHDVYVTDWIDARDVPLVAGRVRPRRLYRLPDRDDRAPVASDGERIAVMAVCQPGIPVMAAAALMAMAGNPRRPASMVLMGSPMDTARNPKQPNELAQQAPARLVREQRRRRVPWPNRGFMRRVYPGFLQLSSFLAMNIDRHVDAHVHQFQNLVRGDGDGTEQHRAFYDEYLAVMDLTAEFYLQTIERVFQKRLMANGAYRYRGHAGRAPRRSSDIGADDRSRARRTTSPASARPRRRTTWCRTCPTSGACTTSRRASATTASSTARAGAADRSRRCATSSWRSAAPRSERAAGGRRAPDRRPGDRGPRCGGTARARRMVLRVRRPGGGPTLTLPPRRAARRCPRVPERS